MEDLEEAIKQNQYTENGQDVLINLQYIACELEDVKNRLHWYKLLNDYHNYYINCEDPCDLMYWLTDGIDNNISDHEAEQIVKLGS